MVEHLPFKQGVLGPIPRRLTSPSLTWLGASTFIAGSSSGRTEAFGASKRGSNPCPAALRLALSVSKLVLNATNIWYYKNMTVVPSDVSQGNNQHSLTTLEITFNRTFAVLLVLTTAPFLKNIYAIPTIILFIVFAFFLWFGKKYHLFTNILFLIFAIGVYFIFLPIGWGLYRSLKDIRLGGFNFFTLSTLFSPAPLIFVTFAVRNILGNIQAYFKTATRSRNAYYLISLVIVLVTLLAYPFLDSVKLRDRAFEDDAGGGKLPFVLTKQELNCGSGSCGSTSYSRDYTARFDSSSKKYVYRLYLRDPLTESIVFTAVEADGKKINFITDSRVTCLNCQKDMGEPYDLVFPAGKNIDFIIESNQLIREIKFTEQGDKVADFFFWK